MKNKTISLLLLLFYSIYSPGQANQISSWVFAGIVNGFEGTPLQDKYLVSEPKMERLDPQVGGEIWFELTPRAHPGCKQAFKVGWAFDTPVTNLREGQTVNVQVTNIPINDRGGIGLKDCFALNQQRVYDDNQLTITFRGGAKNSIHNRNDYGKYWGPKSPYLFSTEPAQGVAVLPVGPSVTAFVGSASASMQVKDGMKRVGEMDAPHGSFCIEIAKPGVFRYLVTYLFDGKAGAAPVVQEVRPMAVPAGAQVSAEAPVVQHNVRTDDGSSGMLVSLPGAILNARGKALQVVVRFADDAGRDLRAGAGEAYFRDADGFVAASAQPVRIPGDEYSFQDFVVSVPYSALNLPRTGYQAYRLFTYAEVFVDGESVAFSPRTMVIVVW